jgi:hypothetical protein
MSAFQRLKDSLQDLELQMVVRSKQQHAIYQHIQHQLKSFGVNLVPEPRPETEYVPHVPATPHKVYGNGIQWSLVDRYNKADDGSVTWRLIAKDKNGLVLAQKAIAEAYNVAREERNVGFLVMPADAGALLAGRNDEGLRKLERESSTRVKMSAATNGVVLRMTGETAMSASQSRVD